VKKDEQEHWEREKKKDLCSIPLFMKPASWSTLGLKVIIALLILIGYLYKIELEHKYERDIQMLEKRLNETEAIYNKTLESIQKNSSVLIDTLTTQLKEIEEHNENLNRHNRMLLEQNKRLAEKLLGHISTPDDTDTGYFNSDTAANSN
jgi:DNA repair exonuclease SbcCD ATPase subunit